MENLTIPNYLVKYNKNFFHIILELIKLTKNLKILKPITP